MNSAGIDFIQKYIPMGKDNAKRADLEVRMIKLVDIVENGADKGPMPFSLYTSEGGEELFFNERLKNNQGVSDTKNHLMMIS